MNVFVYFSATSSDIRVDFKMPTEAVVGSSVELKCEWRILGMSKLYSVKWYKDDHEIFRYMPESNPKTQMFPRVGVKVEVRILCHPLYLNFNSLQY